jgi:hypothetical protein
MEQGGVMIADLIRSCKTEAAVYLLLTDYIETMRRHQNGCRLPLLVTRLPIGGRSDVAQRFRHLISALLEPSSKIDQSALIVIIEALRAFGAAVCQLTMLDVESITLPELKYAHAA